MTHLTDEQLVDAADGTLSPAPSAHVAHCAACAAKVDLLRRTLADVRTDDVPDPSPLFWDGLAARVSSSIDAPAVPARVWSFPAWHWALAAAVLVVVMIGVQYATSRSTSHDEATTIAQQDAAADPGTVDSDDSDADEAWSIVQSVAADLHVDDAREAGVMPRPGAIERAATELSPEERAELVRLIEDELKRTGA